MAKMVDILLDMHSSPIIPVTEKQRVCHDGGAVYWNPRGLPPPKHNRFKDAWFSPSWWEARGKEQGVVTALHERIARVLGWKAEEARSFSLPALRELVRPISPKLVHEITLLMRALGDETQDKS